MSQLAQILPPFHPLNSTLENAAWIVFGVIVVAAILTFIASKYRL